MAKPCPIHACEQTRIVQNTLDALQAAKSGGCEYEPDWNSKT